MQTEAQRLWYQKNKERLKTKSNEYYYANYEKAKKSNSMWRESNLEYKRKIDKIYRDTHKKQSKEYRILYQIKNAELLKEKDKKRIRFRDKLLRIGHNPRIGICSRCEWEGITHMHHLKYDENNPTAYTIELCPSCHTKTHHEMRRSNC